MLDEVFLYNILLKTFLKSEKNTTKVFVPSDEVLMSFSIKTQVLLFFTNFTMGLFSFPFGHYDDGIHFFITAFCLFLGINISKILRSNNAFANTFLIVAGVDLFYRIGFKSILDLENLIYIPILVLLVSTYLFMSRLKVKTIFSSLALVGAFLTCYYRMDRSDVELLRRTIFIFSSLIIFVEVGRGIAYILTSLYSESLSRLRKKNENLMSLKETNSALIAMLVHDISNPLSISKNLLKFIMTGAMEGPQIAELGRRIDDNLSRINDMIINVRTFKATEDGKMEIKLTGVNLIKIVEEGIRMMDMKLSDKNIRVNYNFTSDVEEVYEVWAEEVSLLNSVINNILSNAIKFSDVGRVIDVKIHQFENSSSLTIRDYGVGMPEKILNSLFDPLVATSREGTDGEKGTGFGMPIMKMFLDRYGADLEVKSWEYAKNGEVPGTSFEITFKRKVVESVGTKMAA